MQHKQRELQFSPTPIFTAKEPVHEPFTEVELKAILKIMYIVRPQTAADWTVVSDVLYAQYISDRRSAGLLKATFTDMCKKRKCLLIR